MLFRSDVLNPNKPLSHAYLVKAYVEGNYPTVENIEKASAINNFPTKPKGKKQVKKIQNQTTTENGLFVINNEKNNLEIAVKHKEIEIAKNFIALDLDSATIAKGTGLTVENIEQLRNETKKN